MNSTYHKCSYFVSEAHRFKTQTKRFADFGDRVDGHIHASVFDTAEMAGIKTATVGEVANRKSCGVASLSNGQAYGLASSAPNGRRPSRATGLPSIGLRLDDLAGGIGQRHRRAFALLDFGIGKGVSPETAFISAIVIVPLLVSAEHELLRVHIGGFFRFRKQRNGIQFAVYVLGVVVATGDRYPYLENIIGITINDAVAAVVDVVSLKCSQRFDFSLVDFYRVGGVEALTFVIDSLR